VLKKQTFSDSLHTRKIWVLSCKQEECNLSSPSSSQKKSTSFGAFTAVVVHSEDGSNMDP